MLPLYPQLKKDLEETFIDLMQNAARKELGPFADVQHFTQHEGKKIEYNTLDGKDKKSNYQSIGVQYMIKNKDIPQMTLQQVIELMVEKGKEFGGEQAKYNYKVINQITSEVGNVVDGGGKPVNADVFFQVFEKIQIAFDDNGKPQMPTMVIHPHMEKSVRELIEEAETPENKAKFNEIMKRKKEEWDAEQARRKLVD